MPNNYEIELPKLYDLAWRSFETPRREEFDLRDVYRTKSYWIAQIRCGAPAAYCMDQIDDLRRRGRLLDF